MGNYHFSIKVLLVIGSTILAFWLTNVFSENVYPIQHTTLSYIICGSLLGYVVVDLYNRLLLLKKRKIELELKAITDVALKRYDVNKK